MAQAERLALQSDLAWVGEYNGAITGDVSERMVAAIKEFQKARGGKPTGVLNPQERGVLADTARREAGQCRLEDRHRARHRRAARHPQQAGAAADQRRQRRQMDLADRNDPDPVDAAQGSQSDHRKTRRTGEEGAGRPHRRLHRGQAGLLRAVGPAGPEEVLSARHLQGRRGPHPHHPLRSGDGKYRRAGGDRDVECVQRVSIRRAGRTAAAQDRRVRHRRRRQRRRRDRYRPARHRRMHRDHDWRLRQCRPCRRGQGP